MKAGQSTVSPTGPPPGSCRWTCTAAGSLVLLLGGRAAGRGGGRFRPGRPADRRLLLLPSRPQPPPPPPPALTHRLKCSMIFSSRTFSGRFPTQRCLVSRTMLLPLLPPPPRGPGGRAGGRAGGGSFSCLSAAGGSSLRLRLRLRLPAAPFRRRRLSRAAAAAAPPGPPWCWRRWGAPSHRGPAVAAGTLGLGGCSLPRARPPPLPPPASILLSRSLRGSAPRACALAAPRSSLADASRSIPFPHWPLRGEGARSHRDNGVMGGEDKLSACALGTKGG